MALAMLLMLPLGAWADSSGSLFVNDKNSYTKSNPKTFTYEGKSYTGYPMSGASNVWYVPEGTGGYSSTIKMLYMENASIKFVQGTKSIKGLVIVVKGNNKMTYTGGSCIKMEKGDLTIAGVSGASSDKLTLTSSGKYHGAFTTTGGITVKNVNLIATTNTSSAALSADDGPLKFINATGNFTGTLYAKSGATLSGCKYSTNLQWNSQNKYVCNQSGQKVSNISIVLTNAASMVTFPNGLSVAGITQYEKTNGNSCSFTIDKKSETCYKIVPTENTVTFSGSGAVYYCPSKDMVVLANGVKLNDARVNDKGGTMPCITSNGNLSIGVYGTATIASAGVQLNAGTNSTLKVVGLNPTSSTLILDYASGVTNSRGMSPIILRASTANFVGLNLQLKSTLVWYEIETVKFDNCTHTQNNETYFKRCKKLQSINCGIPKSKGTNAEFNFTSGGFGRGFFELVRSNYTKIDVVSGKKSWVGN